MHWQRRGETVPPLININEGRNNHFCETKPLSILFSIDIVCSRAEVVALVSVFVQSGPLRMDSASELHFQTVIHNSCGKGRLIMIREWA